ncbi:MAG: SDR family NAD(P)-dependent oxidoreductase, partial [Cytophagaceae bacterium]
MEKIILITGASTGLGETIANYLTKKNYVVYGTSRSIEHLPKSFNTLNMDVRDDKSIQDAIRRIIEKHGRIDVLINNAGLAIAGPIEALPLGEVQRVFDTNVMGTLRTIQAVLPSMRTHRSGLIINVSSIAAEAGLPFRVANYFVGVSMFWRFSDVFRTRQETKAQVLRTQGEQYLYDQEVLRIKAEQQTADLQIQNAYEAAQQAPVQLGAARAAYQQAQAR